MEILYKIPSVLILVVLGLFGAYLSSKATNKFLIKTPIPNNDRFGCIDGLRGYLALFVAMYHYCIFYTWFKNGEWSHPDTNIINNMGVGSVHIFFMITAYLFIKKIRKPNVNWSNLYISRVFRILPLYYLAVALTFLYTYMAIGDQFFSSKNSIDIIKWLGFYGYFLGDFNAGIITAGVTWTLRYEWLFYISLPLLFIIIKNKILQFSLFIILIASLYYKLDKVGFNAINFIGFFIGSIVALNEDKIKNNKFYTNKRAQNIAIIASLMSLFFIDIHDYYSLLFLQVSCAILFITAILGNDFFGLLKKRTSIILGEVSYSIYLMHGIAIYTVFYAGDFFKIIKSEQMYYMMIPCVTFFITLISIITYNKIEKPMIALGRRIIELRSK